MSSHSTVVNLRSWKHLKVTPVDRVHTVRQCVLSRTKDSYRYCQQNKYLKNTLLCHYLITKQRINIKYQCSSTNKICWKNVVVIHAVVPQEENTTWHTDYNRSDVGSEVTLLVLKTESSCCFRRVWKKKTKTLKSQPLYLNHTCKFCLIFF